MTSALYNRAVYRTQLLLSRNDFHTHETIAKHPRVFEGILETYYCERNAPAMIAFAMDPDVWAYRPKHAVKCKCMKFGTCGAAANGSGYCDYCEKGHR